MPSNALVRYTIPMPDKCHIPGRTTGDVALNSSVLSIRQ